MTPLRTVAVYLGSRDGHDARQRELAADVGALVAERGIGLVYGGGRRGLMGALADAVLAGGGRAVGVIPRGMVEREVAHDGLTELVVVESMHERKTEMARRADAFLTLPGGMGTLDEFVEALTWTQLGLHAKPSGLLNAGGYYDDLLAFFERAGAAGFVSGLDRLLLVDDDAGRLLDRLAAWEPGPAVRRLLEPREG